MGSGWMRWCAAASFAVALTSAPAVTAQDKADKPAKHEKHEKAPKDLPPPPFWGKVSAEKVNVRMAPNKEGLIIRTAKEDESVLVVGREGGWLQVAAPEGAWCWIRSGDVKKSPEGESVTKKDATLRGDSRNNAPEVGTIAKGKPVKILVEKGEWMKIQAPPSVGYWMSDDYVAFDRAYDASKDPAIEVGKKPGGETPGPGVATPGPKATPEQLRAEIEDLRNRYNQIQREHQEAIARLTQPPPKPEEFDAEGWVDTLGLYFGRPGTHALVKGGKPLCYLKSGDPEKLNLNSYYNQYVGVRGKAEQVKGMEPMRVITVETVKPLTPQ